MRVVDHFTNEDGNLQVLLLFLLEIQEEYTERQLVIEIFPILDSYYIKDCVGYFMINNVTANDRIITCILDNLFSSNGLEYNSK